MAPVIAGNATGITLLRSCTEYPFGIICRTQIYPATSQNEIARIFQYILGSNTGAPDDDNQTQGVSSHEFSPYQLTSTTPTPKTSSLRNGHDETLQFIAFNILLPIVLILIAICFVLGVVLIVKSYMMAPLKQNLATAIRRRRRVGHAPENNYIPPAEMRASQRMSISSVSDRKSLPPPEVLMAARERASQLLHV